MKNFVKILVAILALVMAFSMVACKPTDTPEESSTPSASSPQGPGSSSSQGGSTGATRPEEADINTVINGGFITGADFLDGKVSAENGGNGNEKWTGTTLEGYAIMSNNPKMADTKSEIEFDVAVSAISLFKFNAKVDSAEGDVFYVAVDGKKAPIGDLEAGEYELAVLLTEGEHKVRFVYQKDSSGNDGTDTVYVSNVVVENMLATIDGEMDDIYADASKKNVKVPKALNQPAGYNGLGATAYIINDKAGLYIYAEVLDKTVTADTNDMVDDEDVFKIYLDYVRSFEETALFGLEYRASEGSKGSLGLGWVGVTPDGKVGTGYGFSGVDTVLGAAKQIEGGYAVEMFIPLATSKIKDATIGYGFQCVNDTDACFYNAEGDMWYAAYETLPTYTLK